MKQTLFACAIFCVSSMFAQDNDLIELLRSDIQTEKKAIITENMLFTEEESTTFWPLYNDYQHEFGKIQDELVQLVKDYTNEYEVMTDETALALWTRNQAIQAKKQALDKKYFKIMDKALATRTVVKFFQIENRLEMLLDIQLQSELPLITH